MKSICMLLLAGTASAINLSSYPGVTFYPQLEKSSDNNDGCGSGGCDQFKLKYKTLLQESSDPIQHSAWTSEWDDKKNPIVQYPLHPLEDGIVDSIDNLADTEKRLKHKFKVE